MARAARVEWSSSASEDLENCARYIARDSPLYAVHFLDEMEEAADSLILVPELGRIVPRASIVPEVELVGLRELIRGNYRLIYEVQGDTVLILGLIHSRRDLRKAWKDRHD